MAARWPAGRDVRQTNVARARAVPPGQPKGPRPMIRLLNVLAVSLLIAAAPAGAQTIGFSQIGNESDWRTPLSADMRAETKSRGIDLRMEDADGSADRQIAAVRLFVADKVDAIVIAPVVVP